MTVQELITHLQQIDPNTSVFRQGSEGGYNEVNNIITDVYMALDIYEPKYFGSHEQVEELDQEQLEGKVIVRGIII
jgi:uncharacterized protein (UPF0297 family)